MNSSKPIYKSKTFWFNILAFVGAVAENFGATGVVPDDLQPFILPAVVVINLVLRYVTKEGVRLGS